MNYLKKRILYNYRKEMRKRGMKMKFKSKLFYFVSLSLFLLGFYLRNAVVEAAEVQHGFSISEFVTKKESLELVMTGLTGNDIYHIIGISCGVLTIGFIIYVKINEKNNKNK